MRYAIPEHHPWTQAYRSPCVHTIFFHPDYTVGLGISPNPALRLVGFTTGGELHPALKILIQLTPVYAAAAALSIPFSYIAMGTPQDYPACDLWQSSPGFFARRPGKPTAESRINPGSRRWLETRIESERKLAGPEKAGFLEGSQMNQLSNHEKRRGRAKPHQKQGKIEPSPL